MATLKRIKGRQVDEQMRSCDILIGLLQDQATALGGRMFEMEARLAALEAKALEFERRAQEPIDVTGTGDAGILPSA